MAASTKRNFTQVAFELLGIGKDAGLPEIQDELEEKKIADTILRELHSDEDKKAIHRHFGAGEKPVSTEKAPEPAPKPMPVLEFEQVPAPQLKVAAPSIIAEGTSIVGEIHCGSSIEVKGSVEGDIESANDVLISGCVIGNVTGTNIALHSCKVKGDIIAKASIEIDGNSVLVGDLTAEQIFANGKIKGNIIVQKAAKLNSSTYMLGNLKAGSVEIVQGASITGTVEILAPECAGVDAFNAI